MTPSHGQDRDVVENVGADRPLLPERWQALSRRTQVTIAVSTGALTLGLLLGYHAATRPPPSPPDPLAATSVRINSVQMPHKYSLDFGITLRITSTSPITIAGTRQAYDGLLQTPPAPGATLRPGRTLVLHTRINVYCQLPLPPSRTPLLFITVRNTHREGQAPVLPTPAQATDINHAIQQICTH